MSEGYEGEIYDKKISSPDELTDKQLDAVSMAFVDTKKDEETGIVSSEYILLSDDDFVFMFGEMLHVSIDSKVNLTDFRKKFRSCIFQKFPGIKTKEATLSN